MNSECDRDLLRIATVGNRWQLLLTLQNSRSISGLLKNATSNSVEYNDHRHASVVFYDLHRRIVFVIRIRSLKGNRSTYRTFDARFFNLPQIAAVLEVGDTASPTGLKSGYSSIPASTLLICLTYFPSAVIK